MWLWSVMGRRVVRINSSWNCVLSGKSWYPMRNVHGHEFTHAAASCGAMREPNLLRADPALCGVGFRCVMGGAERARCTGPPG